jgi:hypothetical protein
MGVLAAKRAQSRDSVMKLETHLPFYLPFVRYSLLCNLLRPCLRRQSCKFRFKRVCRLGCEVKTWKNFAFTQ